MLQELTLELSCRGRITALSIAQALRQLHGQGLAHQHLRSTSVLLSRDGNIAKVADAGLATVYSRQVMTFH